MKAPSPLARPFTAPPDQATPPLKAMANYLLVCAAVIAVFWASLGMAGITLNSVSYTHLEEAALGCKKTISYDRLAPCEDCNGTGRAEGARCV